MKTPATTALCFLAACGADVSVLELPCLPGASILEPADGAMVEAGQPVGLTGVVGCEGATDEVYYAWWVDGLLVEDCEGVVPAGGGGIGNVRCTATLGEGDALIQLEVWTDGSAPAFAERSVVAVAPDAQPDCAVVAPDPVSAGPEGAVVRFEGWASDDVDAPGALSVTWSSDKDGVLGTSKPDSDGSVVLSTAALSHDTHQVSMVVGDKGGGLCTASVTRTVGTAPEVAITSPLSGQAFPAGTLITFEGRVSDDLDDPDDLDLSWTVNDIEVDASPANQTGYASFYTGDLPAGDLHVALTATDGDGIEATVSIAIGIEP
jgi:hypothetical protein